MRLLRLICPGFLAALTLAARAEEPPTVRLDFAYASRAVVRGVERAGDALQAGVEFSRDEWRGGLRTSQPLGGGVREADVHAGYVWPATESVSIAASIAHFWYGDVPGGGVERSIEAGLAATFAPVSGFTPTLAYRRDFRFRSDSVELALARSVPLTKWGAFLEFNFFTGVVHGANWRPDAAGARRRDAYQYWGGEVSLPYRVGPHTTVVAGLHAAGNAGRSLANGAFGRPADAIFWATLGVTLDF
jgi:hypothetical protein